MLTPAAESAVKEPLSVAPNNPLYSPTSAPAARRAVGPTIPLYAEGERIQILVLQAAGQTAGADLKVQPQLRTRSRRAGPRKLLDRWLPRRRLLLYRKRGHEDGPVHARHRTAWHYSSIAYPQAVGGLKQLIDSLQATSLLRVGAQYSLDSLTLQTQTHLPAAPQPGLLLPSRIAGYLADTTAGRRQVALRLNLRPNVPQAALMPYRVGDVTVRLTNIKPGPADTLRLPDATVIARRPLKIRPGPVRALTAPARRQATVDAQNRTQTDLNKLGIFRSVNLSVTPLDSLRGSDTLDVEIDARFDYPLEAALETDVTSKSNSFIGPGVTFRVSNNNLFHGGEVLSVKLNGSYE